jgi:hypothetical protein
MATVPRPRHFLLGAAALAATPVGVAATLGSRAWRHPLAAPVREPATTVYEILARRGVTLEAEVFELLLAIAAERRIVERATDAALADGTLDRLVERVLESDAAAEVATQIVESEPVRQVVSSIATGSEVRDAVMAQGTGLANELADQVRERTARVDKTLEGAARRLMRRREARDPVVRLPVQSDQ